MKQRKRHSQGADKASKSRGPDLHHGIEAATAPAPPSGGTLIYPPSYRSFLVRLWQDPASVEGRWRGEVEHIQSGTLIEISSLAEVFSLIGRSVEEREEQQSRGGDVGPRPHCEHLRAVGQCPGAG